MLESTKMMNAERFYEEIQKMPADEQMKLKRLLGVPEEGEVMAPNIKAAWQTEVQRRKQRLEAGETSTQPWEEVEAELMSL